VVDLVRLEVLDRGYGGVRVGELELDELDAFPLLLRSREDSAENVIATLKQQLSQVGAVLPADSGDKGTPRQGLVRAPRRQHCRDRPEQDRDVQPDRPVLQVIEVEADEVVEAQV
jgi:hypothetical protein